MMIALSMDDDASGPRIIRDEGRSVFPCIAEADGTQATLEPTRFASRRFVHLCKNKNMHPLFQPI